MFIRVNKTPNSPRKSIQICENHRIGKKVKQKIVQYVGVALDDKEEQKLKDYAKELIIKITLEREKNSSQGSLFPLSQEDIKGKTKGRPRKKVIQDILPPSEVNLNEIEEKERLVEGVHEVVGTLFDEFYKPLFKKKREESILRDVVLARLVYPSSKRETQKKLAHHFGKEHSLDRIYAMMDKLYPLIGKIKQMTFQKTHGLFPEKMDFILFDVTTLYFESVETDELRNFGYSKDHRFNTTQVVLALATNQDGLPVGYELFEGNAAEVNTLTRAIESWKDLFKIGSVCFIGDRAMFSKKNRELLEAKGYEYIIAAKLKSLSSPLKQSILNEDNYHPTELAKDLAWIGEFEHEGQRLIVSYKTKRALKDEADRQAILNKLNKVLGKKGNPHQLITNHGVKKFISRDNKASIQVDEEKVNEDSAWDGLHGIITNIKNEKASVLLARYARLWVIEESFRVNKHTLEMRPIFHFKKERIHAHIAIAYMAFSLLRHLQYRVNLSQKLSINTILDTLLNVQASIYVHKKTNDLYRLPGYFNNDARKIYKTFNLHRSLDASIYLP